MKKYFSLTVGHTLGCLITCGCLLCIFRTAIAEPISAAIDSDKSRYSLFNPTPVEAMRGMVTDRPDITESPISVDAGHFQIEVSFAEYARDTASGEHFDDFSLVPINFKAGLTNDMDLQVILNPYASSYVKGNSVSNYAYGLNSNAALRLKKNFWGNDGPSPELGNTAFGIMPFLTFPTGSGNLHDERVGGGMILPFAAELPGDFDVGTMLEIDLAHNEDSGNYETSIVHSATFGHAVPGIEDLAAYTEYVGTTPTESGAGYEARASFGFTYALTTSWILDWGGTAGMTSNAPNFTAFMGNSFRF